MSNAWPLVRVGDVLRRSNDTITVDPESDYPEITVKLWGKGVVLRGVISGGSLAGSRRFIAKTGQFIVSRIDARNGAMGIVPPGLDGALVTNDFPLFDLDPERLDPEFIGWYSKTQAFVSLCRRASEGTTNRVRLKEERFLGLELRLPTVHEQRRIVARIEELIEKVAEARALRSEVDYTAAALENSRIEQAFAELRARCSERAFGSFSPHVTSGPRNWSARYEQGGWRFYRAQDIGPRGTLLGDNQVFVSPPEGAQGRSAVLEPGDLLLVITGATVGRVALFEDGCAPGFVSQHVAICRFPQGEVDPRYVRWGLRSPTGKAQLIGQRYGQGKPGLNLANIRNLRLPFPTLSEQREVVEVLEKWEGVSRSVRREQQEVLVELDALTPAILARAFKGEL